MPTRSDQMSAKTRRVTRRSATRARTRQRTAKRVDRLTEGFKALEGAYRALKASDAPLATPAEPKGGGGGAVRRIHAPLPFNPDLLDVCETIRTTVAGWAAMVVEGKQLQPRDAADPIGTMRFLSRHAEWIDKQDWAADMTCELFHDPDKENAADKHTRPLLAQALSLLNADRKTRNLGLPCPGAECGGQLQAVIGSADAQLPAEIQCSTSREHVWDATQWRALRRAVEHKATGAGHASLAHTLASKDTA